MTDALGEFQLHDAEHAIVKNALTESDPDGSRFSRVLRATYDQLYDGQHTGRYSWEQLHKTERTHFGTLIEINIRREFDDVISDGDVLDFSVNGIDIDCKYSQSMGGWMIPPEAFGKLLLVVHAKDREGEFAVGIVRARDEWLRPSSNRDGKRSLSKDGCTHVDWIHFGAELLPNVLLQIPSEDLDAVFARRSGQQRTNELFRRVTRRRIGRAVVATVAQQDDFMKRVRSNGGARSALRDEGIIILGGDYKHQPLIAKQLGIELPLPGEMISVRVAPATGEEPFVAEINGALWKSIDDDVPVTIPAPVIPRA